MTQAPERLDKTPSPTKPVESWMLVVGPVFVLLSALNYLTMFRMGLNFADLFAGFGSDLPGLTTFVLVTSPYYGVLTLIGLIPCIALFKDRDSGHSKANRRFIWISIGFVVSLVAGAIFIAAMYLPIFRLGAVVQ